MLRVQADVVLVMEQDRLYNQLSNHLKVWQVLPGHALRLCVCGLALGRLLVAHLARV